MPTIKTYISGGTVSLNFKDIWVTQDGLRNVAQLPDMVEFAVMGGRFDRKSLDQWKTLHPEFHSGDLIRLVQFEDGKLFVADGHHRMVALSLARRGWLYDNEYFISEWRYEDYLSINFEVKWVTPFDPRTHIRRPDYFEFKKKVYELRAESEEEATQFIRSNLDLYAIERSVFTIDDIARTT